MKTSNKERGSIPRPLHCQRPPRLRRAPAADLPRPAPGSLPAAGGCACAEARTAPAVRGRVLTRYDDGLLPARQGLLGADDPGGGVTHSRDGEEAAKELAGRPGGREHGRAAGQGRRVVGVPEAPLRSGCAARRELRALAAGPAAGQRRHTCAAAVPLPPPRNRGYFQPGPGWPRPRACSARAGPAGRRLQFCPSV